MTIKKLSLQPLTQAAFAPFGDVIEAAGEASYLINNEHTERFHALALAQACTAMGTQDEVNIGISIFRNQQALTCPVSIHLLERHPLGSQAFIPLAGQIFMIVVAKPFNENQPNENEIYAFLSNGKQGVNYHTGVWHHPLMTFEAPSDFLVIDRIGLGHNCDIHQLSQPVVVAQ